MNQYGRTTNESQEVINNLCKIPSLSLNISNHKNYISIYFVITYLDFVYKINLHSSIAKIRQKQDDILYYDEDEHDDITTFINLLKDNKHATYHCYSSNDENRCTDTELLINVKHNIHIYDEHKYCSIIIPEEAKSNLLKVFEEYLTILNKYTPR